MDAFFAFLGILFAMLAVSAVADRGTREHIVTRFSAPYSAEIPIATRSYQIIDLSWLSSRQRRRIWQYGGGGRLVILGLAAGLMLTFPNSIVLLAGGFALFLAVSGHDSKLILEHLAVHKPYPVESRFQRFTEVAAYVAKVALVFLSLVAIGHGLQSFSSSWLSSVVWMSVGLVLLSTCHLLPQLITQLGHTDGSAAKGFGIDSSLDSVLFLRSFRDDNVKIWSPFTLAGPANPVLTFSRHRFEEFVARSLFPFNLQLVAIGRPGEKLPKLGALRTYYPDDQWRQAVQTTAARSAAIILVAGQTDGLAWEIQHLRAWGVLGKALFLLPPEPSRSIAQDRLVKLISQLDDQRELPARWDYRRWLAVRMRNGGLEYLVADGRDWASYATAIIGSHLELRGTVSSLYGNNANPETSGRESLPLRAQVSLVRALTQATTAQEEGDLAGVRASIERAESIAQNTGIRGAVLLVRTLYGGLLTDLGRTEEAWTVYEDVANQARLGVRQFSGFPELGTVSAADLELGAWESLANLSARFETRSPRQTHIDYFAVLQDHGQLSRAADVARLIARDSRSEDEAESWFERAQDSASKAGDLGTQAAIELSWGEYLLSHDHPNIALDHLTHAVKLFESQADSENLAKARERVSKAETASFDYANPTLKMTSEAREWVDRATFVARERNDAQVEPAHFILALQRYPTFSRTLGAEFGLLPNVAFEAAPVLVEVSNPRQDTNEDRIRLSRSTRQLFDDASKGLSEDTLISKDTLWAAMMRLGGARTRDASQVPDPEREEAPTGGTVSARHSETRNAFAAAPLENRPTAWDLGLPYTPTAPEPYSRPPGLTADEPMPPMTRRFMTARIVATIFIPIPSVRIAILRRVRLRLQSLGFNGSAVLVGMIEAEFLENVGRFSDEEALIRELLEVDIPGWVTFASASPQPDDQIKIGNFPKTGPEVRDELLRKLSTSLKYQDKLAEWVEVEKLRLVTSSDLRDPEAPRLIEMSVAFALAQAGQHQEAADCFEALILHGELPSHVCLMGAANWLVLGNVARAQHFLELAESEDAVRYSSGLGLKGDILLAAGETEQARSLYLKAMNEAYGERPTIRLLQRRLSSLTP